MLVIVLAAALALALALSLWALFATYRRYLIARHLLIQFSDWTALKLEAVTRASLEQAKREAELLWKDNSDPTYIEDAARLMPFDITRSKEEWGQEVDRFQSILRMNGLSPVDLPDKDWPLLGIGIWRIAPLRR